MILPPPPTGYHELAALLRGRRTVALTGAGISTDSGIPDYRGPETKHRARNPIRYNAFLGDAEARQRYWARSAVGWRRFVQAQPNASHLALARLEAAGVVRGVITQNVDGLHYAAGSQRVVELHGSLHVVRCIGCGAREERPAFQRRLARHNPRYGFRALEYAPDGDAVLPEAASRSFVVPPCLACGRSLGKPDVVFFGESVPRETVEAAWALYDEAEVLLVLGSSLSVYSGYRFARRAAQEGRPLAVVTLGPTRADAHATIRLDAPLDAVLPRLARDVATAMTERV
jgi:NAD-dependent SIR2 family protein deacetylase